MTTSCQCVFAVTNVGIHLVVCKRSFRQQLCVSQWFGLSEIQDRSARKVSVHCSLTLIHGSQYLCTILDGFCPTICRGIQCVTCFLFGLSSDSHAWFMMMLSIWSTWDLLICLGLFILIFLIYLGLFSSIFLIFFNQNGTFGLFYSFFGLFYSFLVSFNLF